MRRDVITLVSVAAVALIASTQAGAGAAPRGQTDPPAPQTTWNVARDFRPAPNQANPSPDRYGNPGVWSYMQGTNASNRKTFHRLPGGFQKQVCHNTSLQAWIGRFFPQPTTIDIPFVASNTSDRTATLCVSGGLRWPAHTVWTHPAEDKFSVIRWTSPMTRTFSVNLSVADVDPTCGNGVVWTLEKFGSRNGGTPSAERIAHAVIPNGQGAHVHASVRVHQGQSLYSIIAAHDHDDVCDSTAVRWVIHTTYVG